MDLSKIKDLKDLQALLELMGKYQLEEIELEGDGQKIRLKKAGATVQREFIGYPAGLTAAMPPAPGGTALPTTSGPAPGGGPAALPANVREITSPMVGTFYRASSPEAEPFVQDGDTVAVDEVVCIIEAMKVMNEIQAGVSGVVREILVKTGESVEFGQPLFRIEIQGA